MNAKQYRFGRWVVGGKLDAAAAAEICREAETWRGRMAAYPLDKTLRLLGRVRDQWRRPGYAPRRRMERLLPGVTGFSAPMVRKGLEELCWTFDPELLHRKIDTELRGYDGSRGLSWEPLGLVLHVLAGNVFVGAAGSLVEGLITGNVSLMKMSSSETVFLPELVRSIQELDADGVVSGALAVFEYSSSQKDVIAELQRRVDAIMVWGAEEAVRGYRDGLPARTKLVVFGPKLSLAVVTKAAFAERGAADIASRLAKECSVWDQNACTAPQICFVEGEAEARRLVSALPAALDAAARSLPPGRVDRDQAVEIQKQRAVFEMAEARGEGLMRESARGLDWTVMLDGDQSVEPSPLHRTLRVSPYARVEEIVAQLEPLRGYIQTVGLAAAPAEAEPLGAALAAAGALRLIPLGGMSEGEIDDPHDGAYDLPQLKRLLIRRERAIDGNASQHLSPAKRAALIDARLRRLVDAARRSPFYGKRLRGVSIDSAADLARVPVLTREEMENNMPPQGTGLGTGPWTGGYITRSGGSTGEPKFSVYDGKDWDAMIGHAVGVFRALGLTPADRLGNFMLAGDLYGSFVSFDHINSRLGLATFAFAGASKPETFVDVWRKFKLNVAQGIPPQLVPFLRRARELEPALTLEKVVYAGTHMSSADREWLTAKLKVKRIASVIGANDGGQIAYQCERMSGALHHAVDDFNYLEIVNERGQSVPDGETGAIVITSLLKLAYPLIRYAVGDRGRIVPGPCACRRTARVLEYLGRADDMIAVGVLNVRYGDFARALEGLPVSTLQVAVRNSARGDSIVMRLETERPVANMHKRIKRRVLGSMETVFQRLKDGGLADLRVELYRPGELPRNPRSGKVKTLVDERA